MIQVTRDQKSYYNILRLTACLLRNLDLYNGWLRQENNEIEILNLFIYVKQALCEDLSCHLFITQPWWLWGASNLSL